MPYFLQKGITLSRLVSYFRQYLASDVSCFLAYFPVSATLRLPTDRDLKQRQDYRYWRDYQHEDRACEKRQY